MNKFSKTLVSGLLAAAMTISAMPVISAEQAQLFAISDNVNEYNRHFFTTRYSLGDERVFTLSGTDAGTLTSITTVKNYTAEDEVFKAVLYAVDEEGKKSLIKDNTESVIVESDKTGEVSVSVDMAEIPDGCTGVVTELQLTNADKEYTMDTIEFVDYKISVPVIAPVDSDGTTNGAHDPTIFKDPVSGKYYAYSTHNLISESADLINWTTRNFSNNMPTKTVEFISNNYGDTTVNGTYWAPDVIYMEGDEHPYWFYLSVSCGLGGRNSAIALVKSDSPWLWDGNVEDCGPVIATKENADYITNAIDANLYTDTDGTHYFIWGSFWGGIQIAPLTADGFVDGVDYTSDTTILETSKSVGHTLFAAPGGVLGPEGPFMVTNEEEGYRYLFVSYGWLGSNYNTRVARMSTDKTIKEAIADGTISTAFVDQNGNKVGTAYDKSKANAWGYKLIGSYQFSETADEYTVEKDSDNNWKLTSGKGRTYYANAHNSAFKDTDGEWYFVHHTKKGINWAGILCVRKMKWMNGWPVVAPTAYAGEKLQKLPKKLVAGRYNLVSAGKNILPDGVTEIYSSRDADLPVSSSYITLLEDGTLADGLGTWEFDDNYTVTIKFAKSGDEKYSQFYKNGDVYTMYAIMGFDKNTREYVMSLTGMDKNCIAQFAMKKLDAEYQSERTDLATTPIEIEKSVGGNSILGFDGSGNLMYAGDPAATVVGDTVYLYVGHDTAETEAYKMPDWACYSSKDLKEWKYEGIIMSASDISWASDTTSAWAGQMAEYNGKYYWYYCTWAKTDSGKQSIGVAVSDSPTGPFKDIGKPLVKGSQTIPETSGWNDIDPTVWIETDENGVEHRYLAWGNGIYYLCELNEDMISVKNQNSDGIIDMDDIKRQAFTNMGSNVFTEAPWIYRRKDADGNYYGQYYTFFAQNWREEMAYAVSDDITSNKWTYKGRLMPPTATSNTNHPSVIDFGGKTYFIYHNGMLEKGSGFRRSVCIQELFFDENGNVYPLEEISTGINGTMSLIKTFDNKLIAHEGFVNSLSDSAYPIVKDVTLTDAEDGLNTAWELVAGLYEPDNKYYVSIQAVNKPGLYLKDNGTEVVLTQNADGGQKKAMTFKTVKPIDGSENGVSFESITNPGRFLTAYDGKLTMAYDGNAENCVFTISNDVSKQPLPEIPEILEDTPVSAIEPGVVNDFNELDKGTLISMTADGATVYDDIRGIKLYINNRSGGDATGNFAIEDGGVTGNALVMNSGKYSSSSRGPRMTVDAPSVIPIGKAAELTFDVKLTDGSRKAKLYFGDSTSTSGTLDTGLSADGKWHKISCVIENQNEVYRRAVYVDGKEVSKAFVVTNFPVFWGTSVDSTGAKVLIDNLSMKVNVEIEAMKANISGLYYADNKACFTINNAGIYTTVNAYVAEYDNNELIGIAAKNVALESNRDNVELDYTRKSENSVLKVYVWHNMIPAAESALITSSQKPVPKGCTAHYTFEDSLADSVTGTNATLTGDRANKEATATDAVYADGYNGKAVSFGGAGSNGIKLGNVITDSTFTASFRFKANEFAAFSPAMFIDNGSWISAPFGYQNNGKLMVWSNNGSSYTDFVTEFTAAKNKWYQMTMVAEGSSIKMYIDGELIGSGSVVDFADENTVTYLGVNNWDTPFNGLIDDLYIYNGKALSDYEVMDLFDATADYEKQKPLTSYFSFDESLTDSVTGANSVLTGSTAGATTTASAVYADGVKGKAISFSGAGSYGVNLGKVITTDTYTVSFKMKANAFTACTAGIFVDADGGSKWVSAPIGWQSNGTLMVWSNDGASYIDFVSSAVASTNKWYNITMVAQKGKVKLYVDGVLAGEGNVANVADGNTNTFLAVNYWDTPFNGMIDELYIYNGSALNEDEVAELYNQTK